MKIIVGLGNPGKKYEGTRHNIGFIIVDRLAEEESADWKVNKKFNAMACKSDQTIFVKPLGFMNNSGGSVVAILSYFKLLKKTLGIFKSKGADLSEILTVVHDDMDIPLGQYRVSIDSGSAGHKGVQSIIDHLKTKNFKRIRVGIAPEDRKIARTSNFVLGKFKKEEEDTIDNLIERMDI
jgi:PTH1 family peptidyl-tRNA hydrolase